MASNRPRMSTRQASPQRIGTSACAARICYRDIIEPLFYTLAADAATGESVAWFQVAEAREQHSFPVAVGFVTTPRGQRIGWCTLAPQVKPWSYRDGLLHSVANYPWMRNGTPVPARGLLDASYFRHYWRAPVTFHTLPDARFSCMMSAVCCKHDYEITLPAEAQMVIDAMPWETVEPRLSGTRLPVRPDGKLQLKTSNEHCRFLGSRNHCLIHQTLGRSRSVPVRCSPFRLRIRRMGFRWR